MMDDNRERKIKKENIRENLWQKKKKRKTSKNPLKLQKNHQKNNKNS